MMIFYSFLALFGVGITQIALAVAHDEDIFHTLILALLQQRIAGFLVLSLSLVELVHILNPRQAKGFFGDTGEIDGIEFLFKEGFVQRPLRQADLEPRFSGQIERQSGQARGSQTAQHGSAGGMQERPSAGLDL